MVLSTISGGIQIHNLKNLKKIVLPIAKHAAIVLHAHNAILGIHYFNQQQI